MMFFMLFLAYAGIVLFFFGYSAAAWVIRSSAMAASTRGALIEFYHLFFQADDPDFLNRNRFQKRRCDWSLVWGTDFGSRWMWAKLVARFLLSQLRHWAWLSGSLFCRRTTGIKGFEGRTESCLFFSFIWPCEVAVRWQWALTSVAGLAVAVCYQHLSAIIKVLSSVNCQSCWRWQDVQLFNPASQAFSTVLKKQKYSACAGSLHAFGRASASSSAAREQNVKARQGLFP